MTPGEAACVTPGEAASMNPGGAVKVGGDAGVRELVAAGVVEALEASLRELVAAGVAEALETSLALPSGASDYHLGAHFVKARREARLVAASRGDYAFLQRDAAQYEEFAQREAHFEKVQREARFATFVARDAESVAAIWRLSAEEPGYSFALAQRVARFAD